MKDVSRRRALYIRGAVLAVVLAAWLCVPAVKSWLSGMVMLFTQRSVQSLQGNINTSALPVLAALKQSVFHSSVMFFLPPRHIVAAVACLGIGMGVAVSLVGSLAGAAIWYWLVHPVLNKPVLQDKLRIACPWITAGLTGLLGGIWGPVMGMAALMKLQFFRCAAGMAAVSIAVNVMYALLCSPYSALLPAWSAMCLRICGTVLLAVGVFSSIKK